MHIASCVAASEFGSRNSSKMEKKIIIIGVIVVIIAISAGLIGSSLKRLSTEEGVFIVVWLFLVSEA